MSSLDFELDSHMMTLEVEWRQAYEASIIARAEYQALAAHPKANLAVLDDARERLERAEADRARVMVRIERLEDDLLRQD